MRAAAERREVLEKEHEMHVQQEVQHHQQHQKEAETRRSEELLAKAHHNH